MRDKLTKALSVHDVDYVDIRIEDQTNTSVMFRGHKSGKPRK
jgi:predicted Zn-dependent protease